MKQTRVAVLLFGQETSHRIRMGDDDDRMVVLIWSSGWLVWSSKNDPDRTSQQLVVVGGAYCSNARRSNNMRCWVGLCNVRIQMCEEEDTRENFGIWNMFYFIFLKLVKCENESECRCQCTFRKKMLCCCFLFSASSPRLDVHTRTRTPCVVFCECVCVLLWGGALAYKLVNPLTYNSFIL